MEYVLALDNSGNARECNRSRKVCFVEIGICSINVGLMTETNVCDEFLTEPVLCYKITI